MTKVSCFWRGCSAAYKGTLPPGWEAFQRFATLDAGEQVGASGLCPAHAAELRVWAFRNQDERSDPGVKRASNTDCSAASRALSI